MADPLDTIDKRILYYLARDARRTSAPDITEDLDVSPATIRNRIKQLEDRGVIRGYHANIDYEQTGGKLTYLFICDTDTPRREYFAKKALDIPGVVHARELMSGRQNLHIEAVGEDKAEITRIARALSNLGCDIVDEALVQRDYHHPYQPFGPEGAATPESDVLGIRELAGDAKVLDITVAETADAAGHTIRDLSERGVLDDNHLIVAIERDGEVITPTGTTEIRPDDLVTVFAQEGEPEAMRMLFTDRSPDSDTRSRQES